MNNYAGAINDFQRARWKGTIELLLARLTGRSADLLSYEDVRKALQGTSQSDKGLAEDMVQEAGFIAGKNATLKNSVNIVSQWLDKNNADKDKIEDIDLMILTDPLYFELAGDLYASIDNNKMAKKLWNKAIDLGSSEERVSKKINSN